MAQTPEAKVKDFVKKKMKAKYPEAWFYSPPGGMFGKAGTPDLLYLYKGVFIAIECKANTEVTQLQMKTLKLLSSQGAVAAVVKGRDEDKMNKIFASIDNKLRTMRVE